MSQIITSSTPGLIVDGVTVQQVQPAPAIAQGAATGTILIPGTANWGQDNQPIPFANPTTDGAAAFGNGTGLPHSLLLAATVASPECISFIGIRVTDGTDTAATIAGLDITSATLVTLTAKNTGSLPNPTSPGVAASLAITLQSGATTGSPVYEAAIAFPGFAQEQYANITGYVTAGSGFSAVAFKANFLATINGTVANQTGSPNWTATAGGGTAAPQLATNFNASGGTDGASGVGTAQLLGSPTLLTGAYAGAGQISGGQLLLADMTDGTATGALVAYALQNNCITHMANVANQITSQDIAFRAANNVSNGSLVYSVDWDFMFDSVAGIQRLVNPSSKIAGIIAGQAAYMYVGSKPSGGVATVTATERTSKPVQLAEGAQRQASGISYLTNNPSLFNPGTGYGLPHGKASDGITNINDVRMLKKVSFDMQGVLGPLVGQMQSAAANDPIRKLANARLNAYFQDLLNGSPQQIAAYNIIADTSNNTALTVSQGKLIIAISVTTLAGVEFIIAMVQVGSNVQIITQTAA